MDHPPQNAILDSNGRDAGVRSPGRYYSRCRRALECLNLAWQNLSWVERQNPPLSLFDAGMSGFVALRAIVKVAGCLLKSRRDGGAP